MANENCDRGPEVQYASNAFFGETKPQELYGQGWRRNAGSTGTKPPPTLPHAWTAGFHWSYEGQLSHASLAQYAFHKLGLVRRRFSRLIMVGDSTMRQVVQHVARLYGVSNQMRPRACKGFAFSCYGNVPGTKASPHGTLNNDDFLRVLFTPPLNLLTNDPPLSQFAPHPCS